MKVQLWYHSATDVLVVVQGDKAEAVVFNPAGEEMWIGQRTETLGLEGDNGWVLEAEME